MKAERSGGKATKKIRQKDIFHESGRTPPKTKGTAKTPTGYSAQWIAPSSSEGETAQTKSGDRNGEGNNKQNSYTSS